MLRDEAVRVMRRLQTLQQLEGALGRLPVAKQRALEIDQETSALDLVQHGPSVVRARRRFVHTLAISTTS
jgi:hypothetical protein